ncbi:MAG: 23S rRNA (pseudouridine(1915)-N(3))-methyltransferase RlmH [Oscillospiraceae bacterium]|nr:23S rRNA (pseudouridine(1915)-N(3))-methyltransferase RlmH [Oscillospiraceae bacterium]
MLTLEILCIGKLNAAYCRDGCAEYEKRLSAFVKTVVTELPETKLAGEGAALEQRVIDSEGERLLAALDKRKSAAVVALCVEGESCSSEALAQYIARTQQRCSHIVFVIGGSLGLSDAVKRRADARISASAMTFPHQLMRLLLLEQLYRAETILNNVKYHK